LGALAARSVPTTARAGAVVHDHLLAETLAQRRRDGARNNVIAAGGRKRNNDAHRPRRIGLRPCNKRQNRQRGSARGQIQKSSAWKFHDVLPDHAQDEWTVALIATLTQVQLFFECLPADGMSAAA
jgi:hypothetical protein